VGIAVSYAASAGAASAICPQVGHASFVEGGFNIYRTGTDIPDSNV
jgi:hypothetical protein